MKNDCVNLKCVFVLMCGVNKNMSGLASYCGGFYFHGEPKKYFKIFTVVGQILSMDQMAIVV